MLRRRFPTLACAALLWGCSNGADAPPAEPARDPLSSELSLEVVDAGTGEDLSDALMTVRYLVRSPITLDETAVDEVPSSEPYRIAHAISADSLVVEIRLEAPSYMRLDTVIAVERGGSSAGFRVELAPREDRVVARPARRDPRPERTQPAATPPPTPVVDRSALLAGDRAFNTGDWRGASDGYARMPLPPAGAEDYAREYIFARVRLGISRINLGEWDGARAALRDAVDRDPREYAGYFYLGQVQCTLGEFSTGRQTLGLVTDRFGTISEAQRPVVLALVEYQKGVCSHGELQSGLSASALTRVRRQALADFQSFISQAEAMSPVPAALQPAVGDARRRMQEMGSE